MKKTTQTPYDQAEQRVWTLGLTEAQQEFCLQDWPDGDEHWTWLLTAAREEILSWCQASMYDENHIDEPQPVDLIVHYQLWDDDGGTMPETPEQVAFWRWVERHPRIKVMHAESPYYDRQLGRDTSRSYSKLTMPETMQLEVCRRLDAIRYGEQDVKYYVE